jgi:hypothetical protein
LREHHSVEVVALMVPLLYIPVIALKGTLTIYDGMGNAALVQHFMSAAGGTSDSLKTYRARHIRITSEDSVLANSDKDLAGPQRVVEIDIVPKALSVIVGNGIGLSLPMESAPRAAASAASAAESAPHTNGSGEAVTSGPGRVES